MKINPLDNPKSELWSEAEGLADKFGVMASWQYPENAYFLVPQNNSCGKRFAGPFESVADAFLYLLESNSLPTVDTESTE